MTRSISFSHEVVRFLDTFEKRLLSQGRSQLFVSQIAGQIFDVIFDRLPKGQLHTKPTYQGPDTHTPDHSRYTFLEGHLQGAYIASADHVFLISLDVLAPANSDAAVAAMRTSAA